MKRFFPRIQWVVAAALIAAPALVQASVHPPSAPATEAEFQQQVRRQMGMLAALPHFTIFDDVGCKIDGRNVTLYGEVTPFGSDLKANAERLVKSVPGVGTVTNHIEILPLSPFDQQIRIAEARAIFSQPTLSRYAEDPFPPIHIIVKNSNVTLTGVVETQNDKNLAGIRAYTVPNVFSVTNDLQVKS
jgi:hypothetical protein